MIKLFVDFDEVLVQTSDSFCKVYNYFYSKATGFKPAYANMVDTYDFINACPLLKGDREKINDIFGERLLFENLEPMPNAIEVLKKYSDKFEIIICTIGHKENIILKTQHIGKHFPFIKKKILLEFNDVEMDKSLVNMQGAIFIDDHQRNLQSSNAKLPIAFGNHGWCKDWKGVRVNNWLEVDKILEDALLNF